jgi:hypothetical protein
MGDEHKTEMLFFNLGMPWALKNIRWRKFSNESLRDEINRLTVTRNRIAHGRGDSISLQSLKRWKNMIELFAPQFEAKVSAHILGTTGRNCGW